MGRKHILTLLTVVVLFALLYVAVAIVSRRHAQAPVPPGESFRGPTGAPFVKGPTSSPPGSSP